jgi:DNA gyrase subunit B
MPELIEKGHLYVAQPPLYRVVSGKKELYMKDEDALNRFMLDRISEKEKIVLEGGGEIIGKRLISLLSAVSKFYDLVGKLSRRGCSPRFIEFLASRGATDKHWYKNKAFMETLFQRLQENGFKVDDVHIDEESGLYEFTVTETRNGGQTFAVNWEFLASAELRQLMEIRDKFREISSGAYTSLGEGELKKIDDPQHLLHEFMERGKRGLAIQRYKGLGEMNPNQLWSTTMDPEKRTLLQVRIEDAVDADDIFTVLMGDKVEPRREFIQNHALEVGELDI